LVTELVGHLDNAVPGTLPNGLSVFLEIVNEVDLSSSIDSDLIPGSDGQTRVVSRTIVHETFSSSGISLFVDCALERNLLGDSGLEVAGIRFVHEKKIWRVSTRGDVGTSSRNTVLHVGTGARFGVEGFDIEDDWNDVQFQPETGAKVGCLVNVQF